MATARELMRLHVEALFTHDANGDLRAVNEPGGAPVPRVFVGRTADGTEWRVRHDVDEATRAALAAACALEAAGTDPTDARRYETILARTAPVARTWTGPAFAFPSALAASPDDDVVVATDADAALLQPLLAAWIPDIAGCHPMCLALADGRAVAVCASVRRTARAHEGGVETAAAHRGRGHAARAVLAWARAVRALGCEPLYSTAWDNAGSRALARRLGLRQFGSDLHVT